MALIAGEAERSIKLTCEDKRRWPRTTPSGRIYGTRLAKEDLTSRDLHGADSDGAVLSKRGWPE
jgi:hypothetical protein